MPVQTGSVIAEHLQLAERVTALRQGAAPSLWPIPELAVARSLYAALIVQSNERDPLEWLGLEGGYRSAVLAFGLILAMAAELSVGPRISEDPLASLVGDLVTGARKPNRVWRAEDTSEEAIPSAIRVLDHLRDASGIEALPRPQLSQVDPAPLALLADLLRLPASIDVMTWLQQERASLCALISLKYMLNCVIPTLDSVESSPVLRADDFRVRRVVDRNLEFRITRLCQHVEGFCAHFDADFEMPDGALGDGGFTTWQGLERVSDSNGRWFVVRPGEQQLAKSPFPRSRRWRERLTLVGAPALQVPSRMTFHSPNAALASYRHSAATGELIPHFAAGHGPVSFEVDVV